MKPLFTLLLLAIALASYAQPPSAYWYDLDRQRIEAYQQPDVFAFRLKSGKNLDLIVPQVIDSLSRDPIYGFHYLFFAKNSSAQDRMLVKDKIRSMDEFERDFQVFTHDTTIGYVKSQWYLSDDLILVAFQDPYFTPAKVTDFAHRWGLQLHQAPGPGLPKGGRYVYIFKVLEPNRYAADIAHELIEREPETVYAADPNLHGIAQPCGGNDPWFAEQWYIENTGQLLWNGVSGQNDADCDIDQAWDLGYSGEGVMVSV